MPDGLTEKEKVGLCTSCLHVRKITSGKGSEFWMCRKSETDPAFRKYPVLPVLRCPGYDPSLSSR